MSAGSHCSITVGYDAREKTLSFRKNEEEPRVAFQNVMRQTKDLYPMIMFNSRRHSVVSWGGDVDAC